MSPDLQKILDSASDDLSSFVVDLAVTPIDHLARKLLVVIELEGEEEDHGVAVRYRQQAELIEVIGKFRFGIAFEAEVENQAGGSS